MSWTALAEAELGVAEGFAGHPHTAAEVAKVAAAVAHRVSDGSVANARNYGALAAFNYLADRRRRQNGGAIKTRRRISDLQARLARQTMSEAARPELERLLAAEEQDAFREKMRLARGGRCYRSRETRLLHLAMVRAVYLDRRSDLAEAFPGTTDAQRYQWKRRGIKILWAAAGPVLRAWLCDPDCNPGSAVRRPPQDRENDGEI
ncbi:MAG: hypothetical protein GY772_06935 [bacterium]|nr:hypothetical protein [bacterium]